MASSTRKPREEHWSVEAAAAAEVGAGGQARLGEWGSPLIWKGQAYVRPGLSWCWVLSGSGATDGMLHLSRGYVAEREWVLREGDPTLCRRKAGAGNWGCVPCLLPAGYVPAREVPVGVAYCAECHREQVSQCAANVAWHRTMVAAGAGTALRPLVWRSRALWGVRGEESFFPGSDLDREDGEEVGEDEPAEG